MVSAAHIQTCLKSFLEIQYFYVQSIIEIPQEVDDRFLGKPELPTKFYIHDLDGQGMCWSWAEKEILDSKRRLTTAEVPLR